MEPMITLNFKKLWGIAGIVVMIMLAISAWAWTEVPAGAQVPIHWNAAGEPDNYGNKVTGIFLLPLVAIGMIGLFTLIPYIDPKRINILRSAQAYRATLIGLLFFMLAMHVATMLSVVGYNINIGYVVGPAVGIMLMVMGNYLGKIRHNYMFGVRTPWTLASELSWNKTHRFAGKLFVITGIVVILIALWNPAFAIYAMLACLLTTVVLAMAYSYWIWKHDPAIQNNGVIG